MFHLNPVPIPEEINIDLNIALVADGGQHLNLNHLPTKQNQGLNNLQNSPINYLVEEFSLGQLMSSNGSSSDNQPIDNTQVRDKHR